MPNDLPERLNNLRSTLEQRGAIPRREMLPDQEDPQAVVDDPNGDMNNRDDNEVQREEPARPRGSRPILYDIRAIMAEQADREGEQDPEHPLPPEEGAGASPLDDMARRQRSPQPIAGPSHMHPAEPHRYRRRRMPSSDSELATPEDDSPVSTQIPAAQPHRRSRMPSSDSELDTRGQQSLPSWLNSPGPRPSPTTPPTPPPVPPPPPPPAAPRRRPGRWRPARRVRRPSSSPEAARESWPTENEPDVPQDPSEPETSDMATQTTGPRRRSRRRFDTYFITSQKTELTDTRLRKRK